MLLSFMPSVNHLFLAQWCEELNDVDSVIFDFREKLLQIFHFSLENGHAVMKDVSPEAVLKSDRKHPVWGHSDLLMEDMKPGF